MPATSDGLNGSGVEAHGFSADAAGDLEAVSEVTGAVPDHGVNVAWVV
jgi:hypothetical protein